MHKCRQRNLIGIPCFIITLVFLFLVDSSYNVLAAYDFSSMREDISVEKAHFCKNGLSILLNVDPEQFNLSSCECQLDEKNFILYNIEETDKDNYYLVNFYTKDIAVTNNKPELRIQLENFNGQKKTVDAILDNEMNKENFYTSLDIKLNSNENSLLDLTAFWKNDLVCNIYGEFKTLSEDKEYYLCGQDNKKNDVNFQLIFSDKNAAVFSLDNGTLLNDDCDFLYLQLYERDMMGQKILSQDMIDGDVVEDSIPQNDNAPLIPIGSMFKIDVK